MLHRAFALVHVTRRRIEQSARRIVAKCRRFALAGLGLGLFTPRTALCVTALASHK